MGANDYNIERLLLERGIEPRYRRPGYGMYLSPLRSENTPSFKVDFQRNLWYDFGIGQGGGPVDLCMLLDRCCLREAMSKLSDGDFVRKNVKGKSTVDILSERMVESVSLLDYLSSRGIALEVARGYCSELSVSIGGKRHIALGFRNDAGGWEMRNRYLKISTSPKTVTTLRGRAGQCHVFEGFMDYLSFVTLGGGRLQGSCVILNSVVNLPRCASFLKGFGEIYCWLDNDRAGGDTLQRIREVCPAANVVDCSKYYGASKDLNDFLTGKQVTEVKQSSVKTNRLKL